MKSRGTVLVLMVVMLLLASVAPLAAASDKANKPVTCHIDWELVAGTYVGQVTDCPYETAEEGAISFVNAVRVLGSTEHWDGGTVIEPEAGGVIVIEEKGVWNAFKPRSFRDCSFDECYKYRANGQVVESLDRVDPFTGAFVETFTTSEDYSDLIGARTHGMGYTNFSFPQFVAGDPPLAGFLAEQSLRIQ